MILSNERHQQTAHPFQRRAQAGPRKHVLPQFLGKQYRKILELFDRARHNRRVGIRTDHVRVPHKPRDPVLHSRFPRCLP